MARKISPSFLMPAPFKLLDWLSGKRIPSVVARFVVWGLFGKHSDSKTTLEVTFSPAGTSSGALATLSGIPILGTLQTAQQALAYRLQIECFAEASSGH